MLCYGPTLEATRKAERANFDHFHNFGDGGLSVTTAPGSHGSVPRVGNYRTGRVRERGRLS